MVDLPVPEIPVTTPFPLVRLLSLYRMSNTTIFLSKVRAK